jgi:uncharacterized protein YegL
MSKKKVVKKTTTTVTEEINESPVNEKTQIVCILDRSGSMGAIIDDAIGGFNQFLEDQKKLEDNATMTTALFDDQYELLYDNIPLKEVKKFNRETWSPMGLTALYDAIGKTINIVRKNHKKLKKKERPDKVLVCIVTDGMENDSKEYKNDQIKKLINECEEEYGWSFVYLAANQDAFSVGRSFGVSGGNTYTFTADSTGIYNVSATLNSATTYYRNTTADTGDYNNLMANHSEDNLQLSGNSKTLINNNS